MGLFRKQQKSKTGDGEGTTTHHPQHDDIPPLKWKKDPEMSANFFSKLTFFWIQPLFSQAAYLRKHGKWLEQEDLVPLAESDKSVNVEQLFEDAYEQYTPKRKRRAKKTEDVATDSEEESGSYKETPDELERRLTYALIATCKSIIIQGGFLRLLNSALQFSFPILLNLILSYFQAVQNGDITIDDPPSVYYRGYWLSALLMVFVACKAVTESAYFMHMNRCGWRMKTAISSSVYRKSLRLASSAQQNTTLGEIVNLMQVDATKVETFMLQLHTLWDGL